MKNLIKMRKTLKLMRPLISNIIPHILSYNYKSLIKTLIKMRKPRKIDEIPKFNYDEAYLGDLKCSPNSDEFGKVG